MTEKRKTFEWWILAEKLQSQYRKQESQAAIFLDI